MGNTQQSTRPMFSFLLPTRDRPDLVARFFDSIVETTASPDELEIVLAIDADDLRSLAIEDDRLNIIKLTIKPGSTMGHLNTACYEASSGRFVMLVNDDIILRTSGWDLKLKELIGTLPDDICLIHVNDMLFKEKLCTFPMLSRIACEQIGVCLEGYDRYRIDDHIYDIYSMLAYIGHKRIFYVPEVVFEHDNHEAQAAEHETNIFKAADGKVYIPNQEIVAVDAELFYETFHSRKHNALQLASLIEEQELDLHRSGWAARLEALEDSHSYRDPSLVQQHSSETQYTREYRTTVSVSTADMNSDFCTDCIQSIKEHTSDFDLLILDNNRSGNFSHPRDMNQVIKSVRTRFLVVMDDDVIVEAGWLDGMLAAMTDEDTAVVVPFHKDADGEISFCGVKMVGDSLGSHVHVDQPQNRVSPVHSYCSAILLIDLEKVGHILMDEIYDKYFFDVVHGLEVWEAGFKPVVTPDVVVTHLGGATAARGSESSNQFWQSDGALFKREWVDTGRLRHLEEKVWPHYQETRKVIETSDSIKRCIEAASKTDPATIPGLLLPLLIAFGKDEGAQILLRNTIGLTAERLLKASDQKRANVFYALFKYANESREQIETQSNEQVMECKQKVEAFLNQLNQREYAS